MESVEETVLPSSSSPGNNQFSRSCLFCTEEITNVEVEINKEDPSEVEKLESLKNLFRYIKIKINVSKISLEGIVTGGGGGVEELIATRLCKQCSFLVNLFGGLHQDFQTVRLLVKGCINSLRERLKERSLALEPPGNNDGDASKTEFNLTSEILKKCKISLKSCRKAELPRVKANHSEYSTQNEEEPEVKEGKDANPDETEQNVEQQSDSCSQMDLTIDEHQLSQQAPTQPDLTSQKCIYCDYEIPISSDPKKVSMDRHVQCVHTIQHFPQLEGLQATQEDVNNAVKEICKESLPSLCTKLQRFQCSYCLEPKTGDKKWHLIQNHLAQIISRLEAGQEAPTPSSGHFDESLVSSELQAVIKREPDQEDLADEMGQKRVPVGKKLVKKRVARRHRPNSTNKSDFQNNREYFKTKIVKPPFSYVFLIKQAITESPDKKLKATQIYSWFETNFYYFRTFARLKPQIRQTLSMNDCFVREDVGGMAGVWRVRGKDKKKSLTEGVAAGAGKIPKQVEANQATASSSASVEEVPTEQMEQGHHDGDDKSEGGFEANRDYWKSANVKPAFTYVLLIKQAIGESPTKQLKASEIFEWFETNFLYFRQSHHHVRKKWQQGVRSTLTDNKKCFTRVEVGGREGAWRLNPTNSGVYNYNSRTTRVSYHRKKLYTAARRRRQ